MSPSNLDVARSVVRSAEVLGAARIGVLFDGGAASSLLWRLARDHLEAPVPVFVDTGLYPLPVHALLRRMFRGGDFPVDIRHNAAALVLVDKGRLDVQRLPPEQLETARSLTTADSVPYSNDEPVVRRLLHDLPMEGVYEWYGALLSPDLWADLTSRAFMERVGGSVVVRPLLPMTADEVASLVRDAGIPVAEAAVAPGPIAPVEAPLEVLVEQAMAMAEPDRSAYIAERVAAFPGLTEVAVLEMVRERLAVWKGSDRFGHA